MTSEVTLTSNGLYGNASYDLYNGSSVDINAPDNWWGSETTNQMNSLGYPANIDAIYDSFDDGSKGTANYSNWLTIYEIPGTPTLDPVASLTNTDTQTVSGAPG